MCVQAGSLSCYAADWGCSHRPCVAVDSSKFKAVNDRDKNLTEHKLRARIGQIEERIARYLSELDRANRKPGLVPEERETQL